MSQNRTPPAPTPIEFAQPLHLQEGRDGRLEEEMRILNDLLPKLTTGVVRTNDGDTVYVKVTEKKFHQPNHPDEKYYYLRISLALGQHHYDVQGEYRFGHYRVTSIFFRMNRGNVNQVLYEEHEKNLLSPIILRAICECLREFITTKEKEAALTIAQARANVVARIDRAKHSTKVPRGGRRGRNNLHED